MSLEDGAPRGSVSLLPELAGHGVILTPTTPDDAPALAAAASSAPPDAYRWTFVPRTAEEWRVMIAEWGVTGRLIYTVRAGDEETVVGATGFYDLEYWQGRTAPDACEVGHTWYVPAARGTTVNPACKLMIFALAFDTWRVARVALQTDARNAGSRAAMLKLGLTFEGIRRRHRLASDGTIRDSAYFSAVPAEWPAIRRALEARLR